jgi:hypothetical protein
VHLVDHDQPGPRPDDRHDLVGELGVGEPLGRDEQQVDLVGVQRLFELADGGGGRAVDRLAAQPEPRAASIWLRISASSGEISSVGPSPCCAAGAW